MTCAATRVRSDFKEGRDTRLLSVICFPHAEDVAIRATRRVADYHHSVAKQSKANDSLLAVVLAQVFRFKRRTRENNGGILKVEASLLQCFAALRRASPRFAGS